MWIMCNDAFVSIVVDAGKSGNLLVRGRFAGDVRRAMGDENLREQVTPESDYRFRASLPRAHVAAAVGRAVAAVDYVNFKDSVERKDRKSVYMTVWSAMLRWQEEWYGRPGHKEWARGTTPKRRRR